MKKTLVLSILLGVSLVMACVSPDNTQSDKEIIADYLNKTEKIANNIEIIEVSQPDSLYSPYNTLQSISYICAVTSHDMIKYSSRAWKEDNLKKSLALLDSAINLYKTENHRLDSALFKCSLAIDFPQYEPKKINRKSLNAKYRIDGELHENIFFFNRDTNSIGHTSDENKVLYLKAQKSISELDNTYREILRDKIDIRNL